MTPIGRAIAHLPLPVYSGRGSGRSTHTPRPGEPPVIILKVIREGSVICSSLSLCCATASAPPPSRRLSTCLVPQGRYVRLSTLSRRQARRHRIRHLGQGPYIAPDDDSYSSHIKNKDRHYDDFKVHFMRTLVLREGGKQTYAHLGNMSSEQWMIGETIIVSTTSLTYWRACLTVAADGTNHPFVPLTATIHHGVHKAVLSPPGHYIIGTIMTVFLLASYTTTTTISFSEFAGMYNPASRSAKTPASQSSSVKIVATSSTHTHNTQTAAETLPLNARISTEHAPNDQFVGGFLQAATNAAATGETRISKYVNIPDWCKEYLRTRHGLQQYMFNEEEIIHSMVVCLDHFYNMQQKVFDGIVKLAIEKQRSSFAARLEKKHFDTNLRVSSYEINLFHQTFSFHDRDGAPIKVIPDSAPQRAPGRQMSMEDRTRQFRRKRTQPLPHTLPVFTIRAPPPSTASNHSHSWKNTPTILEQRPSVPENLRRDIATTSSLPAQAASSAAAAASSSSFSAEYLSQNKFTLPMPPPYLPPTRLDTLTHHPKTTLEATDSTSVNYQHASSSPAAPTQQVVVASTAPKAGRLLGNLSSVTPFTFSLAPSTSSLTPSTSSLPPHTSSLTPSTSSLPPPHPTPYPVQVPTNPNPNPKNRSLPDGSPFALAHLGVGVKRKERLDNRARYVGGGGGSRFFDSSRRLGSTDGVDSLAGVRSKQAVGIQEPAGDSVDSQSLHSRRSGTDGVEILAGVRSKQAVGIQEPAAGSGDLQSLHSRRSATDGDEGLVGIRSKQAVGIQEPAGGSGDSQSLHSHHSSTTIESLAGPDVQQMVDIQEPAGGSGDSQPLHSSRRSATDGVENLVGVRSKQQVVDTQEPAGGSGDSQSLNSHRSSTTIESLAGLDVCSKQAVGTPEPAASDVDSQPLHPSRRSATGGVESLAGLDVRSKQVVDTEESAGCSGDSQSLLSHRSSSTDRVKNPVGLNAHSKQAVDTQGPNVSEMPEEKTSGVESTTSHRSKEDPTIQKRTDPPLDEPMISSSVPCKREARENILPPTLPPRAEGASARRVSKAESRGKDSPGEPRRSGRLAEKDREKRHVEARRSMVYKRRRARVKKS
ncbi:hypothetical protein BDY19DRAFT_909661 [Irpex rosettiformis]|uniref:Uncharacterized protein n=1 Tax=Irpex rosettiformis TaxID=378272 RepID=A0ACB8TRC4_9APHY|nr:hypothetical protein BDY19DRAFT_909661 [Irpex rosettiformis]